MLIRVKLQLPAVRTQTNKQTSYSLFITYLHDQNKSGFLEGWLLSSQSEQSEKFSKNSDWLDKSWPSKKATFVLIM